MLFKLAPFVISRDTYSVCNNSAGLPHFELNFADPQERLSIELVIVTNVVKIALPNDDHGKPFPKQ